MKNWVLAFVLAAIAIAPIGFLVYHNVSNQKKSPEIQPQYPIFQFETERLPPVEANTEHNVMACKVVDGHRFLMYLENGQHIEAHLSVFTKPEATALVTKLLNETKAPPPKVKLLRNIDSRYWVVNFTLTIDGDRKDLVAYLRTKDLVL